MTFIEATSAMINGSKCIRQGWSGYYLCILANQNFIWDVSKDVYNSTNSIIYTPSISDILAQDWMVKP